MTKYITYFRVSTQRQGESGLGIEAQQAAVAAYMTSTGGHCVDAFTDIESGKKNDREQLCRALTKCRLTGATLLIAKLCRLSRSKAFLFSLMESKVKFVCADMPQANELTVSFMAVMADYEAEVISERTTAALAAAKARGVKLGNTANLTNRDTTAATAARTAAAAQRNAEILAVIRDIEAEHGGISLRATATLLNDAGYTTARGKKFHAASVKRIKDTREHTQMELAA